MAERSPVPGVHTYTVGKGKNKRTIRVRIVRKKPTNSKPKEDDHGTK